MISKYFASLLVLLATVPLSYAANLPTRDSAPSVKAVRITSPDGSLALKEGDQVVVEWDTTITDNDFWVDLTVANSFSALELGPILVGSKSLGFTLENLEDGEYSVQMRPRDPNLGIVWLSNPFLKVPELSF